MAGIIKQIAKKARQALGPELITFLHDKAPCYQSVMADIKKGVITDGLGFDGGLEMAAGKAPDMSYLDAGICPFMEREVEEAGAQSAASCDLSTATPTQASSGSVSIAPFSGRLASARCLAGSACMCTTATR